MASQPSTGLMVSLTTTVVVHVSSHPNESDTVNAGPCPAKLSQLSATTPCGATPAMLHSPADTPPSSVDGSNEAWPLALRNTSTEVSQLLATWLTQTVVVSLFVQ